MTADAKTLRMWVIPELRFVDLAARTRLTDVERKRLEELLQGDPPVSTSNVESAQVIGARRISEPKLTRTVPSKEAPTGARASDDDHEPEGDAPKPSK